jgi:hypothetical protein
MLKSIKSMVLMAVVIASATPALSFSAGATSSTSCQDMMDKAKPMVSQMSDASKMSMAQKEMDKAKAAMDKGKMKTCKSHMNKVMGMVKK